MDIHQLRYFVAVAEERHFGRAAERLMVTPSPLSKQIRRLERELGGDLLIREHHSIQLTPLGQQVLEPIREILQRIDELKTIRSEREASLKLGATPLASSSIIEETLEHLREMLGDDPIDVTLNTTNVLLPLLESGRIDFALVYRPVPETRFVTFDVATYGSLVCMRADDRLADRDELRLSDLADGPLVISAYDHHPDHMRRYRDKLRASGVSNVIEVSQGHPSVMAAHVRMSHARALVSNIDRHPAHATFTGSEFTFVPLAIEDLTDSVAFVALRAAVDEGTLISKIFHELREVVSSATTG